MRHIKQIILLTLLISMIGAKTFAYDIEVTNADGVPIYYNFRYNGFNELEVTCYYIDNSYYDDSGNWVEDYEQRPYSGNVVIPSTVTYYGTTYTVTSIGGSAFSDCYDLTSVTIPNSVTCIDGCAFFNCYGLTSVVIPSGVTYIGDEAFGSYGGSSLASVTVKMETPAEIDSSTFPDRTSETLWVPKGCKAAYETADYWKEFMEIIEISNIDFADAKVKAICVSNWDTNGDGELNDVEAAQVYALGYGTFSNNKSITSFDELQYFTGLHGIGNNAFENCSGLKSVTIPSIVTSIGNEAFSGCSGLTSVNIPSEVTSIGDGAFKNCRSLKDVNYDATNCTKMGSSYNLVFEGCSSFTTLRIGENVQSIPSGAFYGCSGLTSVTIPNSVTSIGQSAFSGCTGLSSVNISDLAAWCKISFAYASDNPLYYAHHLFLNGEEITDLVIPSNVESVSNYAFYDCTGLTSLSIPSSVTGIGENAFSGCSNLSIITVDENNSKYDSRDNCNAIIEKELNKLIYGCKNTVIPSSVTSIDRNAFKGCSTLSSLYIPGSLKYISFIDFEGCTSLTSINVGEGVEEIGSSAFNGLKNVTVTLPNSLTKIGSQAFSGSSSCTVIIGTGIKQLNDAFSYTSGMTIYIHAFERPQTSYHCFYWATNCKSYVPYGRGDAYRSGSSLEGGAYWCSVSEMPYPALTIGSSGYATYCSKKALDFSEVEDVKAYVATDFIASSNTLILTRVEKIPAGEGIIVAGKPGTYDIPECTTDIAHTNLLCGMDYPNYVSVTDGDYTNLLFTDEPSFHPIEGNTPLFAGTAYLRIPTDCLTSNDKTVNVCFDDIDNTDSARLYVEETSVCCGSQTVIPVVFESEASYGGLQCEVTLPEGLSLSKVTKTDRLSDDFMLQKSKTGENTYQILLYNTNRQSFEGSDGALFTMTVDVPDDMAEGDYQLSFNDIVASDVDEKQEDLADFSTTIHVEKYLTGDANRDNRVNVTDIMAVANYILKIASSSFNEKAADVNGDNRVNVTDIMGIANIILKVNTTQNVPARMQMLDPQ